MLLMPSATDLLLNTKHENCLWPEEIKNNGKLRKLAEMRLDLIRKLTVLFERIPEPDMEIADAVKSGLVDKENLAAMYSGFVGLLESGQCSIRLLLYFPFELIPPIDWETGCSHLDYAAMNFNKIYMERWYELLDFCDVKVNFTDGDTWEPELRTRPLERVVKAVHLLPKLVSKRLIGTSEIIEIAGLNAGSILTKSILDTLPVLADMKLFPADCLREVFNKHNYVLKTQERPSGPAITTPERLKWLEEKEDEKRRAGTVLAGGFKRAIDTNDFTGIINSLKKQQVFSNYFYPVVIFFGSRVKGYGTENADLDAAIFVKPGIVFSEQPKLRKLLQNLFPQDKINGKVVEFWLEENDGNLFVRSFSKPDTHMADSGWVHVLFNGEWLGDRELMSELYRKLLVPYIFSGDETQARIWAEEMEKDILQYRLMHKGYFRCFAPIGGLKTGHSYLIGGNSAFYDSGFRRLATKLFLEKVFLPQLKK